MQTTLDAPADLRRSEAPVTAEPLAPPDSEPGPTLRLSPGTELLGQYQDSGYSDPPYLIRRGDGHNIQVSRLVYLVAEALVSRHDADDVAAEVTRHFGREVSPENVLYLVEHKLQTVGLVPGPGSDDAPPVTANPLLALRLRVALVPERLHRTATLALTPLFWPPVIVTALAALLVADVWLLTSRRDEAVQGMRMILFEPKLLLIITLLTLVAGAFHEMGHAAAARYGGARPGAMGAGIYLVWPVFYTDVTDTYRLDRRGRLRTDLGGVYFNVLFTLGTVWLFTLTGYAPLLVLATLVQMETLRQFLPFIRLDGFYVMSDLAGVPNLFAYMRPVLVTLVRRRNREALAQAEQKLGELTRRTRILITAWVVVTAPVLAVSIGFFLFLIPRLAGVAWGSAGLQLAGMTTADGAITPVGVANGTINLFLLALPVAGMTYILTKLLRRAGTLALRTRHSRPATTGVTTAVVGGVLVFVITVVWPATFMSALRMAQDAPNRGGSERVPFETALGNLQTAIRMIPPTSPPAPAIRNQGPDDTQALGDVPIPDDGSPAGDAPPTTPPEEAGAVSDSPPPSPDDPPIGADDRPSGSDPTRTPPQPTSTTSTTTLPELVDPPDDGTPPDEEMQPLERLAEALRELFN